MDRNRGGRPRHPDILTPAEWRVLEELREGGTNAEIAVRLGISPDTVKYHVSNMLAKLGVQDRRELAAWRPEAKRRRRLPAVLGAPAALGLVVRPLGWVAIGAAALGVVAVVTVALVVLAGNGGQPVAVAPPPAAPAPSPSPTQEPPPTGTPTPVSTPQVTPTPQPQATPTPSPEPTPEATPRPAPASAATPEATPSPTPAPVSARHGDQSYEPPVVEFVGELPLYRQEDFLTHVDNTVAYFFDRFGVAESGLTIRFGDFSIRGCGTYSRGIIVLDPGCSSALPHEYAHSVQQQLGGFEGPSPAWLFEGVAERWSAQYYDVSGTKTYSDHFGEIVLARSGWTAAPLRSLETYAELFGVDGGYGLSHLATEWLAQLAGEDAFADYFVRRSEFDSWQDAFQEIFGVTVEAFYEGFESYRARVAPPFPRVAGVVLGQDGAPQEGVTVAVHNQSKFGYRGRVTDSEGGFELAVESGPYHFSLDVEQCALAWSTPDDRFRPFAPERAGFDIDASVSGLVFNLSAPVSEQCSMIEGVVLGPGGSPQPGVTVVVRHLSPGSRYHTRYQKKTTSEGKFGWRVETGVSYEIWLSSGGCSLSWSSGDGRLDRSDGTSATFLAAGAGLRGLVLNLPSEPSESCRSISGVVTDLAGNPRSGVSVSAVPAVGSPSGAAFDSTTVHGAFVILAPGGRYVLSLPPALGYYQGDAGFAYWHSEATVLEAQTTDVAGITFAYGVIRGTVLTADGIPLQGVRVRPPVVGNHGWRTGADGVFQGPVGRGSYLLQVECRLGTGGWYGGEGGFTDSLEAAIQIDVDGADPAPIVINLPATLAEYTRQGCVKPFPPIAGRVVGRASVPLVGVRLRLASVRSPGEAPAWQRRLSSQEGGAFRLQDPLHPSMLELWLDPSTGCPADLNDRGEWVELGRTSDSGDFHAVRTRQRGILVTSFEAGNVVVRFPDCP